MFFISIFRFIHLFGFGTQADRAAAGRTTAVCDRVADNLNGMGGSLQINGGVGLSAVVSQDVGFHAIVVGDKIRSAFGAEDQSGLGVVGDQVAGDEIVRIVMAHGDADAIALDPVVFRDAIPHTPAEKKTDVILPQKILPHDRTLGTGSRMQTQAVMPFAYTALNHHIVANLPTNAIAMVVAGLDSADGDTPAVLQKNAAGVVTVQLGVVGPVAVEGEIFDPHIFDLLTAEQGK